VIFIGDDMKRASIVFLLLLWLNVLYSQNMTANLSTDYWTMCSGAHANLEQFSYYEPDIIASRVNELERFNGISKYYILQLFGLELSPISYSSSLSNLQTLSNTYHNKQLSDINKLIMESRDEYATARSEYQSYLSSVMSLGVDCDEYLNRNDSIGYSNCLVESEMFGNYINNANIKECLIAQFENPDKVDLTSDKIRDTAAQDVLECFEHTSIGDTGPVFGFIGEIVNGLTGSNDHYRKSLTNIISSLKKLNDAYNQLHSINKNEIETIRYMGASSDEYDPDIRSEFENVTEQIGSMSLSPECHRNLAIGKKYGNSYIGSWFVEDALEGQSYDSELWKNRIGEASFGTSTANLIYMSGCNIFGVFEPIGPMASQLCVLANDWGTDTVRSIMESLNTERLTSISQVYPLIYSRIVMYNLVSDNGLLVTEMNAYDALQHIKQDMDDKDSMLESQYNLCHKTLNKNKGELDFHNIGKIDVTKYVLSGDINVDEDYEIYDYNSNLERINSMIDNMTYNYEVAKATKKSMENGYAVRYKSFMSAISLCKKSNTKINDTLSHAADDVALFEDFVRNKINTCKQHSSNPNSQYLTNLAREKCDSAEQKFMGAHDVGSLGDRFKLLEESNTLADSSIAYYENRLSDDQVALIKSTLSTYKDYIDCAGKDNVPVSVTAFHKELYNSFSKCIDPKDDESILNCVDIPGRVAQRITELKIHEKQANSGLISRYASLKSKLSNKRVQMALPSDFSNKYSDVSKYFNNDDLNYDIFFCHANDVDSKLATLENEWDNAEKVTLSQILGQYAQVHTVGSAPVIDTKTCNNITIDIYNPTQLNGSNIEFVINKNIDFIQNDIVSKSSDIGSVVSTRSGVKVKMNYVRPNSHYSVKIMRCAVMLSTISKTESFDYVSQSDCVGSATLKFKGYESPLYGAVVYIVVPEHSHITESTLNGRRITGSLVGSDKVKFVTTLNDKNVQTLYVRFQCSSPVKIEKENIIIKNETSKIMTSYDLKISDASYLFKDTNVLVTDADAHDISSFQITYNGAPVTAVQTLSSHGITYSFHVGEIAPGLTYTFHVSYVIDNIAEYVMNLRDKVSPLVAKYGTADQKQELNNINSLIQQEKYQQALPLLIRLQGEIEESAMDSTIAKQRYDDNVNRTIEQLNSLENFSSIMSQNGFDNLSSITDTAEQLLSMANTEYLNGNYTGASQLLDNTSSLIDIDTSAYLTTLFNSLYSDYESVCDEYYQLNIVNATADDLISELARIERDMRSSVTPDSLSEYKDKLQQLKTIVSQLKSEVDMSFLSSVDKFRKDVLSMSSLNDKYSVWYSFVKSHKTTSGQHILNFPITPSDLKKTISKAQSHLTTLDKYTNNPQKLKAAWDKGATVRQLFYQKRKTFNDTIRLMVNMTGTYLLSGRQKYEICKNLVSEKGITEYDDDLEEINSVLDSASKYLKSGDYGKALVYSYTGMAAVEALIDEVNAPESKPADMTFIIISLSTVIVIGLILYFIFGRSSNGNSGNGVALFTDKNKKHPKKLTKVKTLQDQS